MTRRQMLTALFGAAEAAALAARLCAEAKALTNEFPGRDAAKLLAALCDYIPCRKF